MAYQLVCTQCGQKQDTSRYRLHCEGCGGLLDTEYDTPATPDARVVKGMRGTARYLPTLPINNPKNLVTMGEGNTPIVSLPRVGEELGVEVSGKLEYFNPTCSFKDRGNCVQVSVLKEVGVTEIADITGGNGGHSFAAYCARAGIKYHGFPVKEGASQRKVEAIGFYGTQMHWVDGDKAAAMAEVEKFAEDTGISRMRYAQNIYFIEGQKTMAYEIAEQMDPLPDHIIVPIGNGSILHGLWKGFRDMLEDGRVKRMPRLYGAQSKETQPVVAAFEGRDWTPYEGDATTVASGIGVKEPPRVGTLLKALRESGGRPITVGEKIIISWQKRLAGLEGIFVEPTSAIVIGAAQELKRIGDIKDGERVLLPFTGFGMKEPPPQE